MRQPIHWLRLFAGALALLGMLLLLLNGAGVLEGPTLEPSAQTSHRTQISGTAGVLKPELTEVPVRSADIAAANSSPRFAEGFEAGEQLGGLSIQQPERIDLEQIRKRIHSDVRPEELQREPGWDHEIAVGHRGSLRVGYEPAGGREARDPLSGTLDAEFVVDLFGQASVSAGYRFLNFRDFDGNQELRDALARAQVRVKF